MDEDEIYKLDADERRLQQSERVRATLAPVPDLHYPAPWRVAETKVDGHVVVVVCADGSYTAECPNRETAEAIVLAVNTFAGVAG